MPTAEHHVTFGRVAVTVSVTNIDSALAFYVDVLGFEKVVSFRQACKNSKSPAYSQPSPARLAPPRRVAYAHEGQRTATVARHRAPARRFATLGG